MGSYEGERNFALAKRLSPSPLFFLPKRFPINKTPHRAHDRPLPTVSDRSSRTARTALISPRDPHPGHTVPYAPDHGRTPLRLPLSSFSCRFPSCRDQRPVSWHRPSPLSFPSCHRRLPWPEAWPSLLRTAAATPFPFPQKQKAEPPRRAAPLHSGKTEPETTGVRPPDGPSRRSPPGCSRLP